MKNKEGRSDSRSGRSIGNKYKQDIIVAEENESWSDTGACAENRIIRDG